MSFVGRQKAEDQGSSRATPRQTAPQEANWPDSKAALGHTPRNDVRDFRDCCPAGFPGGAEFCGFSLMRGVRPLARAGPYVLPAPRPAPCHLSAGPRRSAGIGKEAQNVCILRGHGQSVPRCARRDRARQRRAVCALLSRVRRQSREPLRPLVVGPHEAMFAARQAAERGRRCSRRAGEPWLINVRR